MSSKTAWSRSSSVPSDRIPPSSSSQPNRNKGKSKVNEPPKSKEVLRLESLVAGLETATSGKDPKGGCFCLARMHALSKYTPICFQCGLVLCALHAPHYPCPHCASPLLTQSSRETLVQQLTVEISEVLAQEADQRERERYELQKAVGAFPSLATSTGNPQAAVSAQPRKVLSLNAQTRKVTVASYVPAPPPARVPSKADAQEEEERRVPPPPKEVDYVRGKAADGRRWQYLRDDGIVYVPPPSQSNAEGSRGGRKRKKKGPDANRS